MVGAQNKDTGLNAAINSRFGLFDDGLRESVGLISRSGAARSEARETAVSIFLLLHVSPWSSTCGLKFVESYYRK